MSIPNDSQFHEEPEIQELDTLKKNSDFFRFLQSSIRNRLTAIVIGVAIIPVLLTSIILGATTYTQVRNALVKDAFDKLEAVQVIKQNQLESYLAERETDMLAMRETMAVLRDQGFNTLEGVQAFKKAQIEAFFAERFANVDVLASNADVIAALTAFDEAPGTIGISPEWLAAENIYGTWLTQYKETYNYYDLLLISNNGDVVYTVAKESDLGQNLLTGTLKASPAALAFQGGLTTRTIQDYLPYEPSAGANAMFIAAPVKSGGRTIGVIMLQIPIEETNAILQDRAGLYESSESYLVGRDVHGTEYRSTRVVKTGEIGEAKTGEDVDRALAGESGRHFKVGSTGVYEGSTFEPLDIPGLDWAIITSSNMQDIFAPQTEGEEKDYYTLYKEFFDYHDLFLIGPNGFIFYSVEHKADYQTNMLTGEYSDSNMNLLLEEIIVVRDFEFEDFAYYAPSDAAAAFFGMPLLGEDNEIELFIVVQVSLTDIDAILSEGTGLGESGETYVLGDDQLWRNNSRFLADLGAETTVLNEAFKVDTVASRAALAQESGQGTIQNYRDVRVLSVWSSVEIDAPDEVDTDGRYWALIAEIDEAEALGPVNQLSIVLATVIGLSVLAIGALAVFLGTRFALGFVEPILTLTDTASQIAGGNLDLRVESDSKDELGTLADTFDSMTAQLQDTLSGMEQQVADRTQALATSTEVSRRLSTILDQDQLVKEVVEELVTAFDYYYAHIYLFEEDKDLLVMKGGTGEAGQVLLARGHTIPTGRGLVGRSAESNEIVLVNDTLNEEGWLPNELLPETRSEIAVPISIGDEVLGVFDVQHNVADAFSEEDAGLLQSLASQVAIASQNANVYVEAQNRAVREALIGDIGQKIQNTVTVEDALQVAVRELSRALNAEHSTVQLKSQTKQDEQNEL